MVRPALAAACLLLAAAPPDRAEPPAPPRTLTVAAASSLKPAMDALVPAFEAATPGATVRVTFGASGAFVAQLRNGAPFDVFLSADRDYPRQLVRAGLGTDEVVYAVGTLVVWAPAGSPLDLAGKGLAAVADPAVRKLAIANPQVAPYGRAAEAALRAAGVYEAVKDRLVLGQSVAQAAQFARSGAADAALLPYALALSPELRDGKILKVPPATHPPLEHSATVLRAAREPALARAFLAFLAGPKGRAILAAHGYEAP